MPPSYIVMISAAIILLLWFWWRSPSRRQSRMTEQIGQNVIDEAATAFDDIARQIVSSGQRNSVGDIGSASSQLKDREGANLGYAKPGDDTKATASQDAKILRR